jgi:uncharacterized protein
VSGPGPGSVIWRDLFTPDVDAATAFYGQLFGWEYSVWEDGAGDLQIQIDGEDSGGVFPAEEHAWWLPYVWVEDVDELLPRVRAAGGDVELWPETVDGFGRSADLVDPFDTPLAALEPEKGLDWPDGSVPGRFADRSEILVPDVAAATRFYEIVFRWPPEDLAGRIAELPRPVSDPLWLTCVQTEALDQAVERATSLGATLLVRPDVERRAILQDPTGAVFGLV